MTGASATQHGRFDEPQGGAGAVGEEDAVNNWDDADEPWESWYDVGQICTNGHVVNWASKRWPQHNQARCSLCGAETTTVCVFCKHEIRGEYHVYNLSRLDGWTEPVPAYCRGCGAPHQWTKARLDAALELATEVISFTPEERAELAKSLPDLVADTPKTTLAAGRFKRLMIKAGAEAAAGSEESLSTL